MSALTSPSPSMSENDPARLYDQATRAEQAKDWDAALRLYIRAAEAGLRRSRAATSEPARKQLKADAARALTRAERIKAAKGQVLRPVVRDPFSVDEQRTVLDKSSSLNGVLVPAWNESRPMLSLEQPALSPRQLQEGAAWRRLDGKLVLDPNVAPHDVKQDIITDCSLCASIVTCLEHRRRFRSSLLGNVISLQADGSIHGRLLLNGTYRRSAVIDQSLPAMPDGRLVCLQTSTGSHWPAFVEKVYLKAMSGYDFRGSDSATDLLALIGWLPEHAPTRGPDFAGDRTWTRIHEGFNAGHCLVTLGTGTLSNLTDEARALNLLQNHCYAVISVDEAGGDRYLTILNPDGYSPSPGTIRLVWEDACDIFDGVYMSWDPHHYAHHLTFHGTWTPRKDIQEEGLCVSQAELQLTVAPADTRHEIFVVLLRHVINTHDDENYIALRVRREEVFSGGQDDRAINEQHTFTRATYSSVRLVLPPSEEVHKISIAALHEGIHERETAYTVMVYSQSIIKWEQPRAVLPFTKQIAGNFTPTTAGGNSMHPTFMNNPQYRLQVHPPSGASTGSRASGHSQFRVVLRCGRDLPVNSMVVWSGGSRVFEIARPDVAMDSGAYTYGFAATSGSLRPGQYTVIVSAHSPGHFGPFQLSLESTERFEVDSIPQEGAGMYAKSTLGEWAEASAAGDPSSGMYSNNPMFELSVPSPCKIIARLQLTEYVPSIPLNLTVFPGSAHNLGRHVATSGPYSDALPGVTVPDTAITAGTYLLIPSTFRPGAQAHFKIVVYSTVGGVQLTRKQ